jgi:alpha-D-ribose 1-methylphosphonate 5-triphosphate synthase subunit PhnI
VATFAGIGSIDLSPLFSEAGRRDRKLNENSVNILEEQKTIAFINEMNQTALIKANLAALRTLNSQYELVINQTVELIENAEALMLQGVLSAIELQTYRLQLQKRESVLADNEDQIWYFTWYLSWWIEN